jgi:hypothetical protein
MLHGTPSQSSEKITSPKNLFLDSFFSNLLHQKFIILADDDLCNVGIPLAFLRQIILALLFEFGRTVRTASRKDLVPYIFSRLISVAHCGHY